jgi:hypothetical protein
MDRAFRKVLRGAALEREAEKRMQEADDRVLEAGRREQEMAANRVNDVNEYIWLITTRTQALKLLGMVSRGEEGALRMVDDFLAEIEEHK